MLPAPPRVDNIQRYRSDPPPEHSRRCLWWVNRILNEGWRGNSRIHGLGYYASAEYFGVYIWEWLNVLYPLLERLTGDDPRAAG